MLRWFIQQVLLKKAITRSLSVTDLGSANSTSSGATLTTGGIVTASPGDWILAVGAADNAGASGVSSITSVSDSASNNWATQATINRTAGSASDGATLGLYTTRVGAAVSGGTFTINFSPNTTSKSVQIYRIRPSAGREIFVTGCDTTGSAGSATTHSAPSVSVIVGDTIFGCAAVETGTPSVTEDSDTTNGSWSTAAIIVANTGTDATSMNSVSQYKTVTLSGTQDWACTTGSARDSARTYIIFRAV